MKEKPSKTLIAKFDLTSHSSTENKAGLFYTFENEYLTPYRPEDLEAFSENVTEICSDFINSFRKPKPYINALSYVLFHLTKLMHEDVHLVTESSSEIGTSLFFTEQSDVKDFLASNGYRFYANRSASERKQYRYNRQTLFRK